MNAPDFGDDQLRTYLAEALDGIRLPRANRSSRIDNLAWIDFPYTRI